MAVAGKTGSYNGAASRRASPVGARLAGDRGNETTGYPGNPEMAVAGKTGSYNGAASRMASPVGARLAGDRGNETTGYPGNPEMAVAGKTGSYKIASIRKGPAAMRGATRAQHCPRVHAPA